MTMRATTRMKLILLREADGEMRYLPFGPVMLLACVLACCLFAAWLAPWGAYLASGVQGRPAGEGELVAEWREQLEAQQEELARLRRLADSQSRIVGMRLAEMQARMLRMEALGERVTEVAAIDSEEFSFGQPVAIGGPEAQTGAQLGFTDFSLALDSLSTHLDKQARQLGVLETVLVEEQFKDATAVKGRPVRWGWMSSAYGQRVDPFSGKMGWHAGVDFAGKENSDIVAVASGVVVYSGKRSGYGLMIEIDHGDGYATRYAHHKEATVATGDVVKRGQKIAVMGSTGRSTGPHVHFEVLKNGKPQNPAKFVNRRS